MFLRQVAIELKQRAHRRALLARSAVSTPARTRFRGRFLATIGSYNLQEVPKTAEKYQYLGPALQARRGWYVHFSVSSWLCCIHRGHHMGQ